MHLFCDESGNTGVDLLNVDQPLFALASTSLDSERAAELVRQTIPFTKVSIGEQRAE